MTRAVDLLTHALWLFQGGLLPIGLAIALFGALGPAVLRARGAWLLWLCAAGIWLVVFLAIRLFHTAGADLLQFLAYCLGLVAVVTLLLAKFHWSVRLQSFVGLLLAIALPPALGFALLYPAMTAHGDVDGR
jgi:hypothetical protein